MMILMIMTMMITMMTPVLDSVGFWKEGEKIKLEQVWSVGPAWEGPRLENLFVIKFAQKEEL
jgi:hypothetical protein